jgi:hypothetical protein
MASSAYVILAFLAIVALMTTIVAIWRHEGLAALRYAAAAILFGGIILNFLGLRHVGNDGTNYSWASLPSYVFSVPMYLGAVLLVISELMKLGNYRRANRAKKPVAQSPSAPSAVRDLVEVAEH